MLNLRDITIFPDEKRPQFSKYSNLDIIIIHKGVLIYPVKDSAEKGIVFSKYGFFYFVWDPKLIPKK